MKFPTDPSLPNEKFTEQIIKIGHETMTAQGGEFSSIGIGMAGFIDGIRGIVYESPNIPGIHNLELKKIVSAEIGIPTWVENDANAAAWGEYKFGNHGSPDNMLVLTLGTGNGGGLVLNEKIFRGAHGFAGEIGQMVYEPWGHDCPGGAKGCFEHYTGKSGLMNEYQTLSGSDQQIEPKEINERANSGEKAAIQAWERYGERLGIMLASVGNLLDLDLVVLTGGLIGGWDNFYESLMHSLKEHLISPHKEVLRVKKSTLGGDAGILGAAFLDNSM
jgi:glucokinase